VGEHEAQKSKNLSRPHRVEPQGSGSASERADARAAARAKSTTGIQWAIRAYVLYHTSGREAVRYQNNTSNEADDEA
jgi:hypothetical protein